MNPVGLSHRDTVKGTEAISTDIRAKGDVSEWLAKDAEVVGRMQHPLLS